MRKAAIPGVGIDRDPTVSGTWLDLEVLATAELSSEDPAHPFEDSLKVNTVEGWRASKPGPQLIRIRFDNPQPVNRIHIEFREEHVARSQEFALFATSQTDNRREIVRQQWVFSPGGATTEVEDYFFDLKAVTMLELEIDPGRHDKHVFASLQSIQIG